MTLVVIIMINQLITYCCAGQDPGSFDHSVFLYWDKECAACRQTGRTIYVINDDAYFIQDKQQHRVTTITISFVLTVWHSGLYIGTTLN